MSTVSQRAIYGAVAGLALVGTTTYYLMVLRPIDSAGNRLKTQLTNTQRERQVAVDRLMEQKNQLKGISAEIQRLKLFDLRSEGSADSVLASRSNVGLIALSEVFQHNNIIIETISQATFDQTRVKVQELTQGGILHQRYVLRGQGRYGDLQNAFQEFRSLPPTLEVDRFDVEYLGSDGGKAIVYFDLSFGFNYLVSNSQYDYFEAKLAAQAEASASLNTSGFGSLLQGAGAVLHGLQGSKPTTPTGSGSVSWRSGIWDQLSEWAMPAAYAAPLTPNARPTINPMLRNGGRPLPRGIASASALVKARDNRQSKHDPGAAGTYTFNARGITLGRSEPFLPLIMAHRSSAINSASPLNSMASESERNLLPAAVTAMPDTQLLAVLLSSDGAASALIQFGGDRLRVRPGTGLLGGAQVAAIGRDYILIRYMGTMHRIALRTDSQSSGAVSPAQSGPSGTMEVPKIPATPAIL